MGNLTTGETLEQFTKRMSLVEKEEEFHIGPVYQGASRAIFNFEGQYCHLESRGFRTLPPNNGRPHTPAQMLWAIASEPTTWWVHSHLICGKRRAQQMKKHYKARAYSEDEYPREANLWYYLTFDTFEQLMVMVYDIATGRFRELWGDEPREYESCIGYLGDKVAEAREG